MACREEFVRRCQAGLSVDVDRNGKRCWVLTLQTRDSTFARTGDEQYLHQPGLLRCGRRSVSPLLAHRGCADGWTLRPQGHYAAECCRRFPGVSGLQPAVLQGVQPARPAARPLAPPAAEEGLPRRTGSGTLVSGSAELHHPGSHGRTRSGIDTLADMEAFLKNGTRMTRRTRIFWIR
jgi:hypothetical protein